MEFLFEAFFKDTGQVLQAAGDATELMFPAGLVELIDEELHFDVGFTFGVEVAAGITAHWFR